MPLSLHWRGGSRPDASLLIHGVTVLGPYKMRNVGWCDVDCASWDSNDLTFVEGFAESNVNSSCEHRAYALIRMSVWRNFRASSKLHPENVGSRPLLCPKQPRGLNAEQVGALIHRKLSARTGLGASFWAAAIPAKMPHPNNRRQEGFLMSTPPQYDAYLGRNLHPIRRGDVLPPNATKGGTRPGRRPAGWGVRFNAMLAVMQRISAGLAIRLKHRAKRPVVDDLRPICLWIAHVRRFSAFGMTDWSQSTHPRRSISSTGTLKNPAIARR